MITSAFHLRHLTGNGSIVTNYSTIPTRIYARSPTRVPVFVNLLAISLLTSHSSEFCRVGSIACQGVFVVWWVLHPLQLSHIVSSYWKEKKNVSFSVNLDKDYQLRKVEGQTPKMVLPQVRTPGKSRVNKIPPVVDIISNKLDKVQPNISVQTTTPIASTSSKLQPNPMMVQY